MPTAPPVSPPPRLGPWSRTWRYLVAVGVGLFLWVVLVVDVHATPGVHDPAHLAAVLLLDPLVGLVGVALLPLRRRYPLPVTAALVGATAVSGSVTGPALLATVSLSTRRRWREVLPVAALWLVAGVAYEAVYRGRFPSQHLTVLYTLLLLGFSALVIALVVATGFYIGARRELLESLRQRAEVAERAQESRAAEARQAERTRIAREMHDVLAHRISLVAMQAGALAYRSDLTREQVAASAEAIRDGAHQALGELREVLGVLRTDAATDEPAGPAVEAPQPTLAELPALLADAGESGAAVDLDVSGLPGGDRAALAALPGTTSRTAFRILQEALTNARKHAPGLPVAVRLAGGPGEGLTVEARNPLPAAVPAGAAGVPGAGVPGAGLGLVGAAERAALLGGTLAHGVEADGRFGVRVWLPWQR